MVGYMYPKFNSSPLKNGWLEDDPFLFCLIRSFSNSLKAVKTSGGYKKGPPSYKVVISYNPSKPYLTMVLNGYN